MRQPAPIQMKFGRLIVVEEVEQIGSHRRVLCQCDCGEQVIVRLANLKSGNTKSCGCLNRENRKKGKDWTKHGHCSKGATTPEYAIWRSMKARCLNPKNHAYKDYGGRGVKVCPRWQDDFVAFLADIGPRPSPEHSLDRIDNDGDYTPENCRWASRKEQQSNRRCSAWLEFEGECHVIAEWSRITGLPRGLIWNRVHWGWSPEEALTTPPYGSRESR